MPLFKYLFYYLIIYYFRLGINDEFRNFYDSIPNINIFSKIIARTTRIVPTPLIKTVISSIIILYVVFQMKFFIFLYVYNFYL